MSEWLKLAAQTALARFSAKSALAGQQRLCTTLFIFGIGAVYYLLTLTHPAAPFFAGAIFLVVVVALILLFIDHHYMVRTKPELLRSEDHEYRMAMLQAGQQGHSPQVLDARILPPIANPVPAIASPVPAIQPASREPGELLGNGG